jgi:hypothetical protein
MTLNEDPPAAAAAAEPNADELDNAEEEFEKLLRESGN